MPRSTSVTIVGGAELRRLSRDLRKHSDRKRLEKELRAGLEAAAKPLVPIIKSNIRALPSERENRRRGKPSTRSQMARSVTLQVRPRGKSAGVSVFMNPRRMPSGKKNLPSYFEIRPGYARLRHPVFKTPRNPNTWVTQDVPRSGYFTKSVRNSEYNAIKEARKVMDKIASEIEG